MKLMKEQNIDPATGGVYFGQLLGMMDHLTFSLGGNGYKAYKYLPYGPVHEVSSHMDSLSHGLSFFVRV
jgi:proline dehydrogenase